jgi:hypothetical protein
MSSAWFPYSRVMRRMLLAATAVAVLALPAVAAHGATATNCGSYSTTVDGARLTVTKVTATGISCSAARRLIKQCITMVGPSSRWRLSQKGQRVTMVNGSRKIAFTLTRNSGDCVGS